MDSTTFREFGRAAIDFIADYLDNIREYDVVPSVSHGYLLNQLPEQMSELPENWRDIMSDVVKLILPGLMHWQSPNMHSYYPTPTSFPSIVGEILSAGFGVVGFNWISSPACTELEMVMMDWIARFLHLPSVFLHTSKGTGGGVIQGSASESIFLAVVAAREKAVRRFIKNYPLLSEGEIRGRLVAYTSEHGNSCIEKAGLLAGIRMRLIPVGNDFIFKEYHLRKAVEEDVSKYLFPVVCVATSGTTLTCALDDIPGLASVCMEYNMWLHVDAAYGGALFALPEYDQLRKGLEFVDSLNFNLHKVLRVNYECTGMWLRNSYDLINSLQVERTYLQHQLESDVLIPEFRHWQISLGRRFRALKVWITTRSFGAAYLRADIRRSIYLAEAFKEYVLSDRRFEIVAKPNFGLVCFRVKGDNCYTLRLAEQLLQRKKIYVTHVNHRGVIFLRFAICGHDPQLSDIEYAWNEIQQQTVVP